MKPCMGCGETLPLEDFYHWTNGRKQQITARCRRCHNAQCAERQRNNPVYRSRNVAAKARWYLANPEAKRIHEGRSIFLHQPTAPARLKTLERAVMQLSAA